MRARSIRTHPLFAAFVSLNLPVEDCAIFGSGPLYAAGLIGEVHDVDVLARGTAWVAACRLGERHVPPSSVGEVVELCGGKVEVYSAWAPGPWDIDTLIDTAETIGGLRFVGVEHVLAWKRCMGRPKDLELLAQIESRG